MTSFRSLAIPSLKAILVTAGCGLCGLALCARQQSATERPTSTATSHAQSHEKVKFEPHYKAGEVVRYQMESTRVTTSHRDGMVADPEGASALTMIWNATVRMEVVAINADGSIHMRTTYEKSVASHQTDSYDPEAEGVDQQYNDLAGKSFDFTLDPSGHVTKVEGFEESPDGQGAGADALKTWLGQMSATSGSPRDGIAIGETWHSDEPVPSSPLEGLMSHSRSTYLRNESCAVAKDAKEAPQPLAGKRCAVIVTQVTLSGAKGVGHDATPPSYKQNNMRTSGDWTGDGESLSYIELSSGRLVSVTQSSNEKMDITMTSLQYGNTLHSQGSVKSKTQLSLLPDAAK